MDTSGLILLVPERRDSERDAVAQAWRTVGGTVLRLGRFWDPPPVDSGIVRVYGPESFCLVLAEKLSLELCSPADELLTTVEFQFARRQIRRHSVATIPAIRFPAFVKSLAPKQIPARRYRSASELESECTGLDEAAGLLVSDIVDIVAEARCFVRDGVVLDCAFYEGAGDLAAARNFGQTVAAHVSLPKAVAMDVGRLQNGNWIVVEFNAAWGAGLNGCDATQVLPAIEAGTRPRGVKEGDAGRRHESGHD